MAKKQQPEAPQPTAAEQSRAELAARDAGAVVVEIYDQVYQLSGTDPAYIQRLASLVDARMRAISAHGATVDSLRVAVLAALNLADELTQAGVVDAKPSEVRVASLRGLLDEVLEDERKTAS